MLSSCSRKEKKEQKASTEINESVILNVKNILGKSMKDVEGVLGKPESLDEFVSPMGGNVLKQSAAIYNDNKFEIMYKDDKANLIFIYNSPDLTHDDNALQRLGLKNRKPTSTTPNHYTSWENVEGIALINCFKDHVFIKLNDRRKLE